MSRRPSDAFRDDVPSEYLALLSSASRHATQDVDGTSFLRGVTIPISDLTSLTAHEWSARFHPEDPIEFGHKLEQTLGGLMSSGFSWTGFSRIVRRAILWPPTWPPTTPLALCVDNAPSWRRQKPQRDRSLVCTGRGGAAPAHATPRASTTGLKAIGRARGRDDRWFRPLAATAQGKR